MITLVNKFKISHCNLCKKNSVKRVFWDIFQLFIPAFKISVFHEFRLRKHLLITISNDVTYKRAVRLWFLSIPSASHVTRSLLPTTPRFRFKWTKVVLSLTDSIIFRKLLSFIWHPRSESSRIELLRKESHISFVSTSPMSSPDICTAPNILRSDGTFWIHSTLLLGL